jgi:hypothetical protein
VQGWVEHALPFFLARTFTDVKALKHVVNYLEAVHNVVEKFSPTALSSAKSRLVELSGK